MSLVFELLRTLRRHWPCYLAEAAGLAFFVSCSSALTLALEHPASPLHQALVGHGVGAALRRVPMGVGVGLVLVIISYSPGGQASGAHINPAVTLAFWYLGKIRRADACWYILAQAGGGIATMLLLKAAAGPYLANPAIHFITTQPGPDGAGAAFVGEFIISFILMAVMLLALHSAALKKACGWLVGALLMIYVIWETPYSGMSVNPSRSLAAAVAAQDFSGLWIYLLAPTAAMWLAAMLFRWLRQRQAITPSAKLPPYPHLPQRQVG